MDLLNSAAPEKSAPLTRHLIRCAGLARQRAAEAIRALDAQSRQCALTGRKFIIDLVTEAPARFTKEVRGPLEAERPPLEPAVDPPGDGAFKIALAGASAADCPSTPCGKIISILPQLR